MSNQAKRKRSPAYQHYPDKWQAGTKHLTDKSYRAYKNVLDWMWLHSNNGYEMEDEMIAWEIASSFKGNALRKIRDELMQKHHQMFRKTKRKTGTFLISNGLKKEAQKQAKFRKSASDAGKASARLRAENKLLRDAESNGRSTDVQPDGQRKTNSPSPSPSTDYVKGKSGTTIGVVKGLKRGEDLAAKLGKMTHIDPNAERNRQLRAGGRI